MDKLSEVVNEVFKTLGQFRENFKEYLMGVMEDKKKEELKKKNNE